MQTVEVHTARVIDAVQPGRPALACVFGAQDQVESADGEALVFVFEPDIQQWLVSTLGGEEFSVLFQPLRLRIVRVYRFAVMLHQQVDDLPSIQLFAPGLTGITAMQDHPFMPDGPALAGAGKGQRSDIGTDWYLGLSPGLAVIGIKNMSTLASGNQSICRVRQGIERRLDRQCALHCRFVDGGNERFLCKHLPRQDSKHERQLRPKDFT
ncbi:hypothetical protein D3C79_781120 [compost metagenome]